MKCPYCAEEIQDAAKKCRYCGEWLMANSNQPVVTNPPLIVNTAPSSSPVTPSPAASKANWIQTGLAWGARVPPFAKSLGLVVLCSLAVAAPYLFIPLTIAWAYFVRPRWQPFFYTSVFWCWMLYGLVNEHIDRGDLSRLSIFYPKFEIATTATYAGVVYLIYKGIREARRPENQTLDGQISNMKQHGWRLVIVAIALCIFIKYIWPLLAAKSYLGL